MEHREKLDKISKKTAIKTTREKHPFLDTKILVASMHLKSKMYSNISLSKKSRLRLL